MSELQVLIKDMEDSLALMEAELNKFKERIVYTNPGDTNHLGQQQGRMEATIQWLSRLKEISGE